MEKNLTEKFLENIYTREQLADVLDDLETARALVYKDNTDESILSKIEQKTSEQFYQAFRKLEKSGEMPQSKKDQTNLFDEIKTELLKIPVCRLQISFNPSLGFIKKMSQWFESETNSKILLDIQTDENVVAGAKVEYAGKYKDFSISSEVEKLLENPNLEIRKSK